MEENIKKLGGLWPKETLFYKKGNKVKSSTIRDLFYDNLKKSKVYDLETGEVLNNAMESDSVFIDVSKKNIRILDSNADKFTKINKIIKINSIQWIRFNLEGKYTTEVTSDFKFINENGDLIPATEVEVGDKLKSSNINKLIGNKLNNNKMALKIKADYGLDSKFREVKSKEGIIYDAEALNLETETGGFDTLGLSITSLKL